MKRGLLGAAALMTGVLFSGDALASSGDLTGAWNCSKTSRLTSGVCPSGPSEKGVCTIARSGEGFTLTFSDGFRCSPAEACVLEGTLSGATFKGARSGASDSEGGVYASSVEVTASSGDTASGSGTSSYTHPSGFKCTWKIDLELTRK
jgi:hypothetical protein